MTEPDQPVEPADETTAFPAEEAGPEIAAESPGSRRPGCLLAGIAGAVGALIGALTAGLLLVIVLAGDDSPDTAAPTNAQTAATGSSAQAEADGDTSQQEAIGTGAADEAVSDDNTAAQAMPPEGSTGDADFWSQVLASSNLFGSSPDGGSGAQSGDGTLDLSPGLLGEIWAQMLASGSGEPGAPLGSRIEGINIKAVLEAVQESVVIVKTPTEENPDSGGSGFVVAADGHIVTNEHVVRDAETVQVRLFGGELLPAELVASDPTRDLAVLKIGRSGLQAVRLGSTEGVEVGDEVIAIGNALGIVGEPTVTAGIVSGLRRNITLRDGTRLVRLIQTDAAINLGNSGGPLVNVAGEVIGVNTAAALGLADGIGYAISIDHAMPAIDAMLDGRVIPKALLGVSVVPVESVVNGELDDERLRGIALPAGVATGALILEVIADSAADEAGLQRGDIILAFGSRPIISSLDLRDAVQGSLPGAHIELRVTSADIGERTVLAVLGELTDP
ncbi:MAG: trypsin-like peptidase domain-containing protein [Acidimicrobiaceae bacterium]|nr:trypsin-like peptidase domain-containing protein [Acidimicrobiaceae bacterium]MCY3608152.1 trypsin-like peptidase domain-containing protein [Acidimicrobiaceae bacterium]MYA82870.1 PDZ domain-containing protein [Acidimicrobiales bacterium]MYH75190.1 PDZ domain-containing protein [Acidimicrobiales bacterium]MYK70932.1 PDZ domain-containing protein [Acidimicrobiales bacterium]